MTTTSGGGPAERSKAAVLEDVAGLAGVSAMTVSRVLNAPEKVRPETRARVLAAVQELGYRPNFAARSLVTGRSGVLGVVSFDTTLYGPASTLYAIERAAREHDYLVNIASLATMTRKSIAEGVDRLRQQSVDGVIVIAPHESAVEGLRDLPPDLPVVDVGGGERLAIPAVAVDHHSGAFRATRHLLDLGHETVHHLSGPVNWIDGYHRIQGWRHALRDREAPPPLVGDWSANSGYEQGKRLCRDPSVTAVFVANDPMALGLIRAFRESGRNVPEDVSVVGYDDVPEAAHFWPPLTTVRQNFATLGRQAFQLLLDRMVGLGTTERRTVEPELVVRESTSRR